MDQSIEHEGAQTDMLLGDRADNRARVRCQRWVAAGCVMTLAGCASTPPPRAVSLDFIEHHSITRDQILAKWGPATASFEGDRVLTYRLRQDKADYYVVPETKFRGWKGVNYDLVLAFDDTGDLYEHRMVAIRLPQKPR